MEDKINVKSESVEAEIKKESQDDKIVANEMNNSGLKSSTDEKIKIKNEPLEEQACGSSLRITNYYSVPNTATVVIDSLTSGTLNNSNDSITFISNGVVKTETEDTSPESNAENKANLNSEQIEAEVKKESESDTTTSNSSKTIILGDNVVKEENATNAIKKENENSTIEQSDLNGISTLPLNDSAPSSAIANILTASIPSTSRPSSSTNSDEPDDVSSSTDQKPPCRYGKNCYRINELHRQNFYHPPGSDPLKSPEKPRCKYGSRCYRKSEDHRKRFIHERSPDNAMSNPRRRKVRNAASQTTSNAYESDSDGSLYDDSYDGSSDEFHPDNDSDSDETDFDIDGDLDAELLNTD